MCGFAVLIETRSNAPRSWERFKKRSAEVLSKRGPDGFKTLCVEDTFCVVHSRLAIVGPANVANQPISSSSGRYVLVFNGEIYNFKQLARSYLNGSLLSKALQSDSYCLACLMELLGFEESLDLVVGMYAVVWIDTVTKCARFARDSKGFKPLYIKQSDDFGGIILSSDPWVDGPLSLTEDGVRKFLTFGFIPSSGSNCEKLRELQPGGRGHLAPGKPLKIKVAKKQFAHKDFLASEHLSELISNAVASCISQDSPGALWLSSGTDSTALAFALAEEGYASDSLALTFDAGSSHFSELERAKKTAKVLGFRHETVRLESHDDWARLFETASRAWPLPFADVSAIPCLALSEQTRAAGYRYAITGDGGDEIFLGYRRHRLFEKYQLLRFLSRILPGGCIDSTQQIIGSRLNDPYIRHQFDSAFHAYRSLKKNESYIALYLSLVARSELYSDIQNSLMLDEIFKVEKKSSIRKHIQEMDFNFYLPENILKKGDGAGMQFSTEIRAPFLHLDANDTAPITLFRTKHLLRNLIERKGFVVKAEKKGFLNPFEHWMKDYSHQYFWDFYSSGFDFLRSCNFNTSDLKRADIGRSNISSWQFELHYRIATLGSWLSRRN